MVVAKISNSFKIVCFTLLAFFSLLLFNHFWFKNISVRYLIYIALAIYVTMGLFKFFKLISLTTEFKHSLNEITKRQDKIEEQIKKVSVQVNKIENKIAVISQGDLVQKITFKRVDENKELDYEDITKNQLELNIKEKNNLLTDYTFSAETLSWDILLQALNFPKDKNDIFGFEALKLAKKNSVVFQALQASEDFLNLLAQDGIYLDDLRIEPPSIQAWINFLRPEKKGDSKKLNCLGIDLHLEKLKLRLKADTVFRDTSLMLARRFDKMLREKVGTASDNQIFKLSYTRSGKAFLIVGSICGIF